MTNVPNTYREADVRGATARLKAKIGSLPVAMVTAADHLGMPTSRPLTTQQFDDDGVLWFFVSSEGTLARDVEKNPRVNVNYSDSARGVSWRASPRKGLRGSPSIWTSWFGMRSTWLPRRCLDPRTGCNS